MSGGMWDYGQHKIDYIVDDLKSTIDSFDDRDEWMEEVPPDIRADTIILHNTLAMCFTVMKRLDWYYSSDDSEETYRERIKEDTDETLENVCI